MDRQRILGVSTLGSHFRLERWSQGFVVTRSAPKPGTDSVSITRWRFASGQGDQAAMLLLDEVIALHGADCGRMRSAMLSALHRAVTAERTMRPGSSAVRQCKAQSVDMAERYFREGRHMVQRTIDLERQLNDAGFQTEVRTVPAWMEEVLRDPEHQNGTSSSGEDANTEADGTGSPSSQSGSRAAGSGSSR
jgi:hypothetical protein